MSPLSLREVAYDSPDYHQCVALRYLLLRQPLDLTFTPADLADDKTDIHLAAYATSTTSTTSTPQLVATLILHPVPQFDAHSDKPAIKMRQVAVAAACQGTGIGRKLVTWSEQVARERGYGVMVLHARTPAVGFYTTLGYRCVGNEFMEVSIPHQKMEKVLL